MYGLAIFRSGKEILYARPAIDNDYEVNLYNSNDTLMETVNKKDKDHWLIKSLRISCGLDKPES